MNTKKRIIEEALILFSEKGYSDVYVNDIAKAVGIKAPSLYKHYKNKQEIFNAILEELKEGYVKHTATMGIAGNDVNIDAGIYADISEEALVEMGKNLFLYFLHDNQMRLFRKLLTIEQFRDSELAAIYSKQYFDAPLDYQSELFKIFIANGKFKQADAKILAMQFYAPIYTLLTICDRHPEREQEALKLLEAHIHQFNINYAEEK
ncbi:MAG: TetR/AcrR family transcriptional regulator [Lachnospiraceae bacterium]|nr:TetR/AcrR family transcriptional regulator [Lachnospiraceae bacterium]